MFWIISMAFALLVCGGAFFSGRQLRKAGKAEQNPDKQAAGKLTQLGAIAVLVLWAGLHTGLGAVNQVPAGHVGVVYSFGKITGQTSDGFQIIAPWKSMRVASTQVQRHQFEHLEAFSMETQDVFITATLNYQISPKAIQELYRNVGPNWFERLVESRVLQIFKDTTVRYRSVDIAPAREDIRSAVRDRLRQELKPFSVDVVDLLVDNIDFRPEFKQAIEQKQIATQDALREQQRVKQKEFEAEQQVATARGDANATIIRAKGQATANRELSKSLTPALIQWQAVQKLADNVQIALVPAGQGIILDPATLLGKNAETHK